MCVRFKRSGKGEFSKKGALFEIRFQLHRLQGDDPLDSAELRPDEERILHTAVRAELAGQRGIAATRCVSHAGKTTTRILDAKVLDQFAAKSCQRGEMDEGHALRVEPDLSIPQRKPQTFGQITNIRHVGGFECLWTDQVSGDRFPVFFT